MKTARLLVALCFAGFGIASCVVRPDEPRYAHHDWEHDYDYCGHHGEECGARPHFDWERNRDFCSQHGDACGPRRD